MLTRLCVSLIAEKASDAVVGYSETPAHQATSHEERVLLITEDFQSGQVLAFLSFQVAVR